MNTSLRIAAAIAVLLFSAGAQARHHRTTEHSASCGFDRGVSLCPGITDNGVTAQWARPVRRVKTARTYADSVSVGRTSSAASLGGVVRSGKTGATAHVAPRYAAVFQAYVDDLEAHGATVRSIGGYRPGPCAAWSEHPCGKALDVCQLARGVVDRRCNLPGRAELITIANRHGLQEGGEWCNSDMGHAQIDRTAARCGHNLYAAVGEFKATRSGHRHRVHYARK